MTPGKEEGGVRQGDDVVKAKNDLRDGWKKLVESEERLNSSKGWWAGT